MFDKDIPLGDRVWAALRRTCRLHVPEGRCARCDERWAAIMQAVAPEVDLISRHDAIVMTVVRDRIIESKKAERYRLAWKSACRSRESWRKLYEYAQGKWYILNKQNIGRGYHDLMMRAYRNQVDGLEQELILVRGERDHVVREMQENTLHLKNEELKRDADRLREELAARQGADDPHTT